MTMNENEILERGAALGVSAWSDALDELGIKGTIQGIARRSGSGCMIGFAVTARELTGVLGDFEKADFAVGQLIEATGPGKVLMVDMNGEPISTMGGLAAIAAKNRQATAVVIDGACRDLDEIRETGLWLSSRWVAPTTGKTRVKLLPIGCDIMMGGISVSQGDLVIGDDTGIMAVPRARVEEILAKAERIVAIDAQVEERIRAGESFGSAAAAAGYIPARKT
ncbi:RraA family protein [Mesorhizobium sp. B2-5-9]|nr:demethylmenaquinone methyltransferase [Mesorhizobium sp. WSM1497]PBC12543.1 demethylmenaquinone methyltransferase [Mesorhizobium loti]TPI68164.1 RraA family protein [Mesorhizobium sp. B2-8-9]TPJ14781.1 RraA family protein [Mesorhizobium sp. B2-7-2]TPJ34336.1 RraA family protein [Mesorhizobium sp. B2-6-5]TPJ37712.1 RraA family protein [Mesorhizobium sp. B2-6-6]TPJ57864.1 RraA family protein [Mesorhizobium sp. B2-6-7]TPJ70211.1 RraA family protein [Mesorhizobium sp. B2-6-2]TPJ85255.1 RraA 